MRRSVVPHCEQKLAPTGRMALHVGQRGSVDVMGQAYRFYASVAVTVSGYPEPMPRLGDPDKIFAAQRSGVRSRLTGVGMTP